ncbi:hypothetical protein [Deinococcus hopiensis]|uniref:Uncharacterized protein n=1 Tax=Deinococcus hopiensis KR-140 TaxID=695939 RepID=A0A1W1UXM5_9DEIO|nr:hypothetical protein [Deinococcus hopiensis]SMB85760.1 hypothetical protein SAMN00790413_03529 [Deinococcus hopiensis KR-140]
MKTTLLDFTAVRGDSLERLLPLEVGGAPMSPVDVAELKARFTGLRFQVRESPDDPEPLVDASDVDGAVEIVTLPLPEDAADGTVPVSGIALHVPATRMEGLPSPAKGLYYDLQLTEPRPGHPLGDLVWTIASGRLKVRKDVTRGP